MRLGNQAKVKMSVAALISSCDLASGEFMAMSHAILRILLVRGWMGSVL